MQEIVQLVLDAHHNTGEAAKYSRQKNAETIREALVELNNGKTYLDLRDIRDGKCGGLFTLVEKVVQIEVEEGLKQSDFFTTFVEEHNIAEGDENLFNIKRNHLFKVSEVAAGTQGMRRQKLNQGETVSVAMKTRGIKVFEEMNRILAGKADMGELIDTVAKSKSNDLLNRMYAILSNLIASDVGGNTFFPAAGSYDEAALVNIIDHVEAAAGAEAFIIGARQPLRQLSTAITADAAKDDMYNLGYVGKYNGTKVVKVGQRHAIGTSNFIFPTNKVFVVAGNEKPLKYVTQGEVFINNRNFADNADLTEEYLCLFTDGLAWIGANKMGIYQFS